MDFLLDTNIVLDYVKGGKITDDLDRTHQLLSPSITMIISAVTVGEMHALALKRQWGQRKIKQFIQSLHGFLVIPINSFDIFSAYGQIDAYSQSKLKNKPLPNGLTARNMGKNDIWIAATAHVTSTTLITTDKDFDHLDEVFLDLLWIEMRSGFELSNLQQMLYTRNSKVLSNKFQMTDQAIFEIQSIVMDQVIYVLSPNPLKQIYDVFDL